MKLFYSKGACSLVARIIINELGLNAQFESVDLQSKKTENGQDFYGINSKGCVPTLQTNDGHVLTENAVILQYLADSTESPESAILLPKLSDFKRYQVLEYLNYIATELHKSLGALFSTLIPSQTKEELFIPLIKSKFTWLNQHLEKNTYLCGAEFTLADAYLFVMLLWASHFKINLDAGLQNYFNQLMQRKAIQKSLQEEHLNG